MIEVKACAKLYKGVCLPVNVSFQSMTLSIAHSVYVVTVEYT